MATRPVFVPCTSHIGVREVTVDFQWFAGMALSQAQKSIASLHAHAAEDGLHDLLEISSKSPDEDGVALSAFNLSFTTLKYSRTFSVEMAFQASKVFERGGPYKDLLETDSRTAKRDERLKASGRLVKFIFMQSEFPLQPTTYFYDWLYINALAKNRHLWGTLKKAGGFTDIAFNPAKSLNCQAFSAALFVSLEHAGKLDEALASPQSFLDATRDAYCAPERDQAPHSLF
ncbi:hypothetical protein BJG93_12480 [Paraburkholderia sprentiae WSM5005]|uniref:Uncharacterized protein n=1 Tax=Paraburkholderia sprentiae WSM5005 TaxID=754502 RepID=A0A1I9YIJ1_9BURK|nr:hypothetical protein [Paraburkholderia sprentiae]APA86124.1 hypothetical protein BJG93_12480 [Paraburkholderia sprentiae WSM5005]